jgi:hypothetical protein
MNKIRGSSADKPIMYSYVLYHSPMRHTGRPLWRSSETSLVVKGCRSSTFDVLVRKPMASDVVVVPVGLERATTSRLWHVLKSLRVGGRESQQDQARSGFETVLDQG